MAYSVIYNLISGVSGTVPVDSTLYTSGGIVTVFGAESLVKDGYAFTSWNTAADGSGTSYTPTSTFTITSDINLYATGWLPRVIYNSTNADSGSAPEDATGYNSGTTVTVLGAGTLVRSGYSLTSWNTVADGSGTSYTFGSTFTFGDVVVNLYPIWLKNYYILYNANEATSGTVPIDETVYHTGNSAFVSDNTGLLSLANHTFVGWSINADGSGTVYKSGDSISIGSTDVILYSVFVSFTVKYTSTNNTGGSAPVDPNEYASGASVVTKLNTEALSRSGYVFSGWGTSGNVKLYSAGDSFFITENVELFPYWIKSSTYKTYLAAGNIVDVCRIGSDIIKVNDSSTKSSITFNIYNNAIIVGAVNSLYTSGISGDLFGEMTSTGFASLGSNLNIGISGYIDLTFTTLTNLSVYVVQGTNNHYLFNGTVNTSGTSIRVSVPKYILSVAKNAALSFKIEAAGSGISVINTSAVILDRG